MSWRICSVIFVATVQSVAGCAGQSAVPSSISADLPADDRSVLAGEWEYEDSAAVALRLDEHGNGTYSYKDGRFETTQFVDHTWVGKWYQKENDCEGGFSVKLSKDHSEGQGTWWYVRIGTDHRPVQKGGTFHLSKKSSLANLSVTSPAP
jgi:hypothetical protein